MATNTCTECGTQYNGHGNSIYCSDECRNYTHSECNYCEKRFRHLRQSQGDFCSQKCLSWANGNRKEVTCEWCEKRFEVVSARADEARFCSEDCFGKWSSQNRVEENAPNWQGGKYFKSTCDYCGDEIEVNSSRADLDNHYCGEDCMAKDRTEKVETECAECGKILHRQPHRMERGRPFCSMECLGAWRSKNLTGASHPSWKGGGVNYYGQNWQKRRRQVLDRDGYECQSCGLSQEKHISHKGEDLHVHHIQPFRTFDSPENANTPENLVTLCVNCHRRIEESETSGGGLLHDAPERQGHLFEMG